MALRVILHIGMPKTGTSSLQRAFASHADLLRRHGIAYALPQGQRGHAHHQLVKAAVEENVESVDGFFAAASADWEGMDRVLLSSERMSGFGRKAPTWWKERLDRQFDNPDYEIWMFIRRPSSHVPSRWHAFLRHGGLQNLPAFAFDDLNGFWLANQLPCATVYRRWADVFGPSALHVMSMEKLMLNGGDLVHAAFRTMFRIESEQLRGMLPSNTALGPREAELLRALSIRRASEAPETVREFLRPAVTMVRRRGNPLSEIAAIFEPYVDQITIEDRSQPFVALERSAIELMGDRLDLWDDGTIFGPAEPRPAKFVRDEHWFDTACRARIDEAYGIVASLPPREALVATGKWSRAI